MPHADELLTRWPALDAAAKRLRLQSTYALSAGPLAGPVAARAADAERAAAGLWRREPSAWSADTAVQQKIANRLGWLSSPLLMAEAIPRLQEFATSIRQTGFADVVLLGMGGSSLAPEVLRAILGVAPGWPRLHMLDSTDPAAIRAASTPPERTLYLFASKSGTTIEPNSLAAHFRDVLTSAGVSRWADHFVAITDEGTELATHARAQRYRDVFINPTDIGGRYSALSYFGMVPAALMGQNLNALVGWGIAMLAAAEPGFGDAAGNPAVGLGLSMGAAALAGRDKLTLVMPASLEPFGLWVEQLVAESTGKHGVGIVPITGEPLAHPADVYGNDRLFVRVRLHGSYDEEMRDTDVRDLQAHEAPLATIDLAEPSALGAEFVRWEVATAVVGALLGINPFDEPNVQQAKDATKRLLLDYKTTHRLPAPAVDRDRDGVTLTLSAAARAALGTPTPEAVLTTIQPGDYFALLAYLGPDQSLYDELKALRVAVRDRTGAATMFGYGPRYLHSTGQLHKGGPNTGVFVVVATDPSPDLPIPHQDYTFGTLEQAQALGDFASLDAEGRRALFVHLPAPDRRLIRSVADALLACLTPRR